MIKGSFVDRSGVEAGGETLVLGNFCAAYRKTDEVGFLIYSGNSHRLFALSKLPPRHMARKIASYMDGRSEDVPMDISKDAALRQFTHRLSLIEQVPKGGPIVWPILGIAMLSLLIILERSLYLLVKAHNTQRLLSSFGAFVAGGKWEECIALCKKYMRKPVLKVLLAGVKNRDMAREDLENVLQEAILNEIPRLERFISTLGMLTAIAPLLGLLGTVTGMINTFHVITFYGTGDPRMMSSDISEALVTTMLGLAVAIPVMLCHTPLSRKVEGIIASMKKNAVSFVNSLFKVKAKNAGDHV